MLIWILVFETLQKVAVIFGMSKKGNVRERFFFYEESESEIPMIIQTSVTFVDRLKT